MYTYLIIYIKINTLSVLYFISIKKTVLQYFTIASLANILVVYLEYLRS